MFTSKFRLQLFGPPALVAEGRGPLKLGTRKALALLAYLAFEQRPVPRSELAALLWPETPEEQSRASLRQELSRLGGVLGPGVLNSGVQNVALHDDLEVDLWRYRAALHMGDLTAAVQLYQGPFLQGPFLREQDLRGSDQPGALREFSGAYANLKAAWNWALEHEHPELAREMIDALFLLYELRGWFAEGIAVFETAISSPDPLLRSLALVRSGRLLYRLGRPGEARRYLEQALEQGDGHIDEYERAFALNNLGLTRMGMGDFAEARQLFQESLALRRQQRRPWGTANSLYNLGILAWMSGEHETAKAHFQEALGLYRFLGDLRGMSLALTGLGQAWTSLGQYPVAREMLRQSLSYGEQLGDHFAMAGALLGLGMVAGIERNNEECLNRLQASLEAALEAADKASIGRALLGLGRLALREGSPERAIKLARQALERFQEIRYRWGEALAYTHLGRTYLAIGEAPDARAYYRLALEEALGMGAIPLALRALAGMSPLLESGLASSVRALVISHPATDAWVREEIKKQATDPPPSTIGGLEELIQAALKTL